MYSVGLDTLLIAVVLAFGLGFLIGQLALVVNSARVLDVLALTRHGVITESDRDDAMPDEARGSDGRRLRTTPRRYVR